MNFLRKIIKKSRFYEIIIFTIFLAQDEQKMSSQISNMSDGSGQESAELVPHSVAFFGAAVDILQGGQDHSAQVFAQVNIAAGRLEHHSQNRRQVLVLTGHIL